MVTQALAAPFGTGPHHRKSNRLVIVRTAEPVRGEGLLGYGMWDVGSWFPTPALLVGGTAYNLQIFF